MRTRVFYDVALHAVAVMKSKAAVAVPPRAVLPAYLGTQWPAVRCGYPHAALTRGSPKKSQARYLPLLHHLLLRTCMHTHVQ